ALVEEKNGKIREYAGDLYKTIELDVNHVGAQVRLAKILLFSGRMDAAEEKTKLVMRLAPEKADVWSLQAALLFRQKKNASSLKAANKALEIEFGHVEASLVIAVDAISKKKPLVALKAIATSRELHPENVPLLLTKMRVLQLQDDKTGIETVFRTLIEISPDSRQFRNSLTRFYLTEGQKGKAEAEIRAIAADNPDDNSAKLDIIRYLQSVSGVDVAKTELIKIISEEPDEYIYQLALAEIELFQKDLVAAKTILQKVITAAGTGQDGLSARVKLAEILLRDRKIDQVNALLEETIAADKFNIEALTMRAALHLDGGRIENAVTDLRSALKNQPDSVKATLLLARAHEMSGAVELADDRFDAAYKMSNALPSATLQYAQFLTRKTNYERAESIVSRALRTSPNDRQLLTSLAQIKLIRKDWKGAEDIAEYLRKLDKDNAISDQILGRSFAGQKDFQKSMNSFQKAYKNVPNGVNTLVAMVRLYLGQGKTEEAEAFLSDITAATPDNYPARLLLAQLQAVAGKNDEAVAAYEAVITEKPKFQSAYYTLFTHYVRAHEVDKAQSVLDRGLIELPNNFTLMMSQAGIYELKKQFDKAIAIYEKILKTRPNVDVVANNLASLISVVYDDEESLRRAYTYAKRFRTSAVPHFKDTLGWIHYRLGEYELATELLEDAVKKMPEFGTLRYHLGMSYKAENDTQKAIEELTKAVELSKSHPFPEAEEARRALKVLKSS
ncbi:MAG: tetratricopeptide repeat protein, partial [Sneathiella sp.]|nr:tetratricopeptide repeat protein [Sneathiella sp.]